VREIGYLPDFMPTFIELAGAEYPEVRNGQKVHPMAGISLAPLFKGGNQPVHRQPVYWEHEGNRAMRDGKWKLSWSGKGPWELYDMEADRTEMHDLAHSLPDRLNAMVQKWETWAKGVGVSFPDPISYYKVFNDSRKQ
jgi:arylsulfatase